MARATKYDTMRQNEDVIEVKPEQELAIAVLLRGGTDQDAAEAAGVTRQTVNTWLHHDGVFVAELNRRRQVVWASYHDQLRALVNDAVKVLADQVRGDDPVAARQAASILLKTVGSADLTPPSLTSPDKVRLEWAKERHVGALEWIAVDGP